MFFVFFCEKLVLYQILRKKIRKNSENSDRLTFSEKLRTLIII